MAMHYCRVPCTSGHSEVSIWGGIINCKVDLLSSFPLRVTGHYDMFRDVKAEHCHGVGSPTWNAVGGHYISVSYFCILNRWISVTILPHCIYMSIGVLL